MGMHTVASVGDSFHGMFECRHCDLEVGATVYAKSSGAARGVGAAAEQIALENAEMDANALAARTLQFVKCPACGKTDPAGKSYRIQATIGAIVLGAGIALLAWLFVAMRTRGRADDDISTWLAIGTGVLMTLMLYWRWGRAWRSPDRRTVFHR